MKIYSALFFCSVLYLASCKKHESTSLDNSGYLRFNPVALSYVQLRPSSYFIYKDSATSAIDSVIVLESRIEKKQVPQQDGMLGDIPPYYYDKFTLRMWKHQNPAGNTDWFYGTASTELSVYQPGYNSDTQHMGLLERDRLTGFYLNGAFSYPLPTGPSGGAEVLPSVTIEGKIYTNVLSFTSINNYISNADPTTRKTITWWVQGIGIIKRTVQTVNYSKTWLLLRYGG